MSSNQFLLLYIWMTTYSLTLLKCYRSSPGVTHHKLSGQLRMYGWLDGWETNSQANSSDLMSSSLTTNSLLFSTCLFISFFWEQSFLSIPNSETMFQRELHYFIFLTQFTRSFHSINIGLEYQCAREGQKVA